MRRPRGPPRSPVRCLPIVPAGMNSTMPSGASRTTVHGHTVETWPSSLSTERHTTLSPGANRRTHARYTAIRATTLDAVDARMNVDLNLPEDRIGPRPRRRSKRVWVGGTAIGDGAPVAVQSMCTTLTHDIPATIRQIERLQEAGCEIARVAVPDPRAGEALKELVRRSILPVVADIHFDYRLALMALDAKVHKLRLNPGNIHNKDGVREVVREAQAQGTPIRIGVNHGSIGDRQPGDVRDEAQRMVDLAMSEIKSLEDLDFDNIVVSVKAFG